MHGSTRIPDICDTLIFSRNLSVSANPYDSNVRRESFLDRSSVAHLSIKNSLSPKSYLGIKSIFPTDFMPEINTLIMQESH